MSDWTERMRMWGIGHVAAQCAQIGFYFRMCREVDNVKAVFLLDVCWFASHGLFLLFYVYPVRFCSVDPVISVTVF